MCGCAVCRGSVRGGCPKINNVRIECWCRTCSHIGAKMGSKWMLKCIRNSSKIRIIFCLILGCAFCFPTNTQNDTKHASQKHAKITTGRESRVPSKRRWGRVGLRVGALKLWSKFVQKSIQNAVNFYIDF